jgi:hypothetical protein
MGYTFLASVGFSTEPTETRIFIGDTGVEAGIPSLSIGVPFFDTSTPTNITAQVSSTANTHPWMKYIKG